MVCNIIRCQRPPLAGLDSWSQLPGLIVLSPVSVLEVSFISSKDFNFSDEVVLVCFGVRLVDTVQFTQGTSSATIRSITVTLEKGEASPQVSISPDRK